ncbi:sensor histidine kinase [Spirosoma panaciterrae]|uniref:sensor histidine kinase n=1 Tax=Spirosoma panaciterrae TaxID=496058 RepID=UPI00035E2333|nr:7TM diverse intracellular signaling domain-containing protein [Spirosoma panaciterrae]
MKRFLLVLLLFISHLTHAQTVVLSDPNQSYYNLDNHLTTLEVRPGQKLTIDSLLQHPDGYHFAPVASRINPERSYWLRINLTNDTPNDFFLRVHSLGNDILVCEATGRTLLQQSHQKRGAAPAELAFRHSRNIFPLQVRGGQTHQLYIYINQEFSIPDFQICGALPLAQQLHKEDWTYGIYYGFALLMALYSLLLFVQLRDRDNLIYGIWVLSHGINIALTAGLTIEWLGTWQTVMLRFGWVTTNVSILLIILFTMSFLSVRQYAPWLYRTGQVMVGVICVSLVVLTLVALGIVDLPPYYFFTINYTSSFIYVLVTATVVLRRGNKAGWFLLLGQLALFVSVYALIIEIFPLGFWRTFSAIIGSAVEMLFFTLGLSYKVNLLKKHQDEAIQEQLRLTQENQQLIETQNRVLEEKVEQRTAELRASQAQLIQKEKLASLGELTAGIAHEIQNPLNFVNNFSEVSAELIEEQKEALAKGDLEEAGFIANDLAQNLQKITHHGGRASAIVKGMLEHSKGGEGKKEPTDLVRLIQECFKIAYQGYRSKHRDFHCDLQTQFQADTVSVEVVTQDIGRVVINVLTNAFYSLRERSSQQPENYLPQVWIRITQQTAHAELRIKDNGTGIPQAIRAKIFQPFFTTKPTGEGTGLGLSLSYDIITKGHGGTMTVESQEGLGTEFIVRLPV